MITALDQLNLDPALAARQQAAASGDPNLFAAQLDKALAAGGGTQAQNALPPADPAATTAALAAQVAQMWASQTAAQPARTGQEEKSLRDSAVLQSMNHQASLAFSQGNAGAFNVLQVMINRQMTDMGLIPPPAAPAAQAATAKASTPKAAAKTGTTARKATAYGAATASVASNASTASSASAALADKLLSNAGTAGASSTQLASNAGAGGGAAGLADAQSPSETVTEAIDHLTWELKTLLSKLDGDDRDAALDGLENMARELAETAAPEAGAASQATA
uniref:Uncharacterized protein n=1 Tax=Fundidesulfovibrio putealis TaxID=270496 RepID=A0A7C3WCR9_9BACT